MLHYDFSGRTVLVMGGTSGIGLASARAFARAGANVVATARRDAEVDGVVFMRADVRDEASVAAAVDATVARFGRLDFAANCAGAGGDMAPLESADQGTWDDVMAVNARGVWLSMRHEIPAIVASGGGAVVNVSSIYGLAGKAAHHAYVASKHAVVGLSRSVALEYAERGVRVNALCAGITATPAMRAAEAALPDLVGALVAEHPMKRMATEDEIANAVLWLCSPGAGFVTGAAMAVDGGFLAK